MEQYMSFQYINFHYTNNAVGANNNKYNEYLSRINYAFNYII